MQNLSHSLYVTHENLTFLTLRLGRHDFAEQNKIRYLCAIRKNPQILKRQTKPCFRLKVYDLNVRPADNQCRYLSTCYLSKDQLVTQLVFLTHYILPLFIQSLLILPPLTLPPLILPLIILPPIIRERIILLPLSSFGLSSFSLTFYHFSTYHLSA